MLEQAFEVADLAVVGVKGASMLGICMVREIFVGAKVVVAGVEGAVVAGLVWLKMVWRWCGGVGVVRDFKGQRGNGQEARAVCQGPWGRYDHDG